MFAEDTSVLYSNYVFDVIHSLHLDNIQKWIVDYILLLNVKKPELMWLRKSERENVIGKEVLTDTDVVEQLGINR